MLQAASENSAVASWVSLGVVQQSVLHSVVVVSFCCCFVYYFVYYFAAAHCGVCCCVSLCAAAALSLQGSLYCLFVLFICLFMSLCYLLPFHCLLLLLLSAAALLLLCCCFAVALLLLCCCCLRLRICFVSVSFLFFCLSLSLNR